MYLLDTNHCSALLQGDSTITRRIDQAVARDFSTSPVVCGELYYMVDLSRNLTENRRIMEGFLETLTIIPIDQRTSSIYGSLKSSFVKQFGPKASRERAKTRIHELGITDNDLWIASTAIQHSLILLSADSDYRRVVEISDLKLESWI